MEAQEGQYAATGTGDEEYRVGSRARLGAELTLDPVRVLVQVKDARNRAFAAAGGVGCTIQVDGRPGITLGAAYATGGRPGDELTEFDNFFPTNHPLYGTDHEPTAKRPLPGLFVRPHLRYKAAGVRGEGNSMGRDRFCGLLGAAPCMQALYERVALAACGRETALIVGESGTGKELVARAIHHQSGDPTDRFVAVNCAALPRQLMESELFGHARGSFSGATERRLGLVREAAGGTLLFDEITELEVEAQAKLLRLLQERTIRPVGEHRELPVRVRILASTNEGLAGAISRGKLRRDLYYRLQRWVVRVPPLRDRLEDLPLLVEHFAGRWQVSCGTADAPLFSPAALDRLSLHGWPGNVRELENVVFQACSAAAGPRVGVGDLPLLGEPEAEPTASTPFGPISLREAERGTIVAAMAHSGGNKTLAARLLGISRKQLYVKLRLYGIDDVVPTCEPHGAPDVTFRNARRRFVTFRNALQALDGLVTAVRLGTPRAWRTRGPVGRARERRARRGWDR